MEDAIVKGIELLIAAFAAHPYVAAAATVAGFIVMAQPLLRALVEWTPNTVDNKILEVVLKIANVLTPAKTKRGAKAEAVSDEKIVINIVEEYKDPAAVPAHVLDTMTEAQREILAKKYEEFATKGD